MELSAGVAATAAAATAAHRESICMHSGIVNRNRSLGPRALVLSIWLEPGWRTGRAYD